jgi:hypothetical protein
MPKFLRVLSILLLAGYSASAQDAQKPAPAEFKIPPEASKLANPVKPTPASLAQERKFMTLTAPYVTGRTATAKGTWRQT